MTKPFISEHLTCSCCGTYFKTREGYVDQDQGGGFGICEYCQSEETKHNEQKYEKMFNLVRDNLSPVNRAKLDADVEKHGQQWKTTIVNRAIKEGHLSFF